MRPMILDISLSAAVGNQVAASQTPAAGDAQELDLTGGAGYDATLEAAVFPVPRHASVTCAGSDHARTFTLTGTDRFGNVISEDIAGSDNGTEIGLLNFKTVTSVVVDDDTAGAVTVGMAAIAESQWLPLDTYKVPFEVGFGVTVLTDIPSDLHFTVQHTFEDVQVEGFQENDAVAIDHGTVADKSATTYGNYTSVPVRAVRLAIISGGSGHLGFQVQQAG